MKLRFSVLAVAVACALTGQAWADEAAAKKWIDSEFQPSTLSKDQQMAEMKWFIDAAAKLKAKGVTEIQVVSETITTHEYESKVLAKAFSEITGINLKHEFVNVEFLGDFLKSKNQKALDVLNLVIEVIILAMCLVILVMAEPKYCFPTFAMNSTATNISMKYIYFSQFLTFIILPVSYLLDIVRTALSWNDTAEKED